MSRPQPDHEAAKRTAEAWAASPNDEKFNPSLHNLARAYLALSAPPPAVAPLEALAMRFEAEAASLEQGGENPPASRARMLDLESAATWRRAASLVRQSLPTAPEKSNG